VATSSRQSTTGTEFTGRACHVHLAFISRTAD
jgi:hypothetical protein